MALFRAQPKPESATSPLLSRGLWGGQGMGENRAQKDARRAPGSLMFPHICVWGLGYVAGGPQARGWRTVHGRKRVPQPPTPLRPPGRNTRSIETLDPMGGRGGWTFTSGGVIEPVGGTPLPSKRAQGTPPQKKSTQGHCMRWTCMHHPGLRWPQAMEFSFRRLWRQWN